MKTRVLAFILFAGFLALWQYASLAGWISPILLPSPGEIGSYLLAATADGTLPAALGITLSRLAVGYTLGLTIGMGLGLLLHASPLARATLGLLALGLQTLPSVCWAPLSLLWFGQTEQAMYFVVVMGSLWAIAIATENAIRSVPKLYIQAARVMGSKGLHTWRTVIFPAALPQLLSGATLGWAFSWRSLMAAEIYVTIISRLGIGQLLHFGRELHAMDQAMAVMVVIVFVGYLSDKLLFSPLEKRLRATRGAIWV